MFARLRLDGLVSGNRQKHQIDSRRAGQHVAHEFFVAGYIHKTKAHSRFIQKCETQIDRDAAAFFFFQTVGICAGQCLHEGRLAVINMSGSPDNDVFQGRAHFVRER